MPLHDRRYKRLHRPQAVNLAWAQQLSDQLGLGTVLPDSMVPHPVEYLTEELTLRLADHVWSFRTERMQGLLLMMEFQSSQDAALALRQYSYAFLHLLAGLESKEYNLRQGLPIPILVSLYHGRPAWQPAPLEQLFAGPLDRPFPLPWLHYDMHHMEPGRVPTQPLLRAIFDIERTGPPHALTYAAVLRDYLAKHQDPEIRSTLFAFTAATMSRWQHTTGPHGTPSQLDVEWEAISTLEELIMSVEVLQAKLDNWIAETLAQGEARGMAQGEAEERRKSLLELAALWLEPHQVEQCRAGVAHMALEEMPTVGGLYQAVQDAADIPATILALLHATPHA